MTLRSNLIRLAHEKPELRETLLPLLKQGAITSVKIDKKQAKSLAEKISASSSLSDRFEKLTLSFKKVQGDLVDVLDDAGGVPNAVDLNDAIAKIYEFME